MTSAAPPGRATWPTPSSLAWGARPPSPDHGSARGAIGSMGGSMLLRYRGSEGMLAWAFHRISGVAVWAFVVLHVVDIYLVGGNPGAYNELLKVYASLPGRIMEVLLGAALLYHALNGLRI